MKLERVALTGFLSHQHTDWSPNGARLISLIGANGAGKSTLASDALTYALWDTARGKTDDVVTLGQTDTSVLVEFTFNGQRYRVERGRTTKSGGKSRLEFAIQGADGAWLPLTRDSIRETQAAIAELLRLEADTFATAVLLGQGQANRFSEATAGDRKRILSTVLGLDVYAAADARARELARDLEAATSTKRSYLEQLRSRATGTDDLEREREVAAAAVAARDVDLAAERTTLASIDARIRELDVALAASEAIAGQVTALEADRAATGEAWRRAAGRLTASTQAIADAERIRAGAGDVAAAAEALPIAQAALARQLELQRADNLAIADRESGRRELEVIEKAYSDAVSTHRERYAAARRRVDELVVQVKALEPVVCEKCGHPNVVDQAGIRQQLTAARSEFTALEGEPKAPAGLLRARAALERLEARRREDGFEPAALAAAHAEVTRLSSIAARGEAMAAAQQTLERAIADRGQAEAEKAALADKGAAIAARIEGLASEIARVEPFREERSRAGGFRETSLVRIDELEAERRALDFAIARADAALEQMRAALADAEKLEAELALDDVEAGILRKLVAAFGIAGIPARVIEGVLPELAGYANELLGELRPGMTLELRAQRAKKDGKGVVEALDLVVRDAAGERPLALFSGGERMSVSLALAVALSRLVARRAGARIESLVVDEPDGLDAAARRAFGQALRVIAHRGDLSRVLVVSHHDDLAEFGDATYEVTKGSEGSVVTQVM